MSDGQSRSKSGLRCETFSVSIISRFLDAMQYVPAELRDNDTMPNLRGTFQGVNEVADGLQMGLGSMIIVVAEP